MAWDDDLTGRALDIARCAQSPLRVMAGPGTGKSFAMKRRVARLLEEGVDPERILAVTFTRNAADSLLRDLYSLGVDGCGDIHCGTLHSFCFKLLNVADVFAFLGRTPRPLVTFSSYGVLRFEGEPLVEDLCGSGDFGGKRDCTKSILAFEAAWARLQSDEPGWALEPTDQAFQAALIAWLEFHNAILIGELVPETLRYLRGNPGCPYLTAYEHVIVDEYQDLNKAEQVLIELLAEAGQQAVVGDVDQSIYSFRHANPDGITQFAATRPGTHDETLDECRRCPRRVVLLADHLIKHNHPPGLPPRLNPRPGNPEGEINIVQWNSLEEEAGGIAGFIRSLIDGGSAAEDILVLCPRRLIGYGIRDAIEQEAVAVHSFYHEEALEDGAAQEAFAILALAGSPDDRASLRWWLGYGSKNWRTSQYARLRAYCEENGISPRSVLEQLHSGALVLPQTNQLIERFAELKARLATIEGMPLDAVVDSLFPEGEDWALGLRESATLAAAAAADIADLKERMTVAVTQPEIPDDGNFVRVMSLHKSKGLTSKTVIVAGCTQGLIPVIRDDETPAKQDELLREQRRLFYVAITRCTDRLILSNVGRLDPKTAYKIRAMTRRHGVTIASQFLHELGPSQPRAVTGAAWVRAGYH